MLRVLLSAVFYISFFVISGCAKAPPPLRALPDFALTAVTVDGTSPLDLRALRGRAWIADFVYTRCAGPCPMLSANMASLQRRLSKSVGLLSFTVDPDHDSPEVLTVYARKFGADPQRWFFVTGDKPALLKLFRDGFQIAVAESADAPEGQNVAHTTKFVLIDGDGRIRGYYDGEDPTALDRLASEASGL
jgi:protein SCO1/2